jgi:hypothetical protein
MVNNTDPLNEDIEFFFDTAYALLRTGTAQQIFDILGNVIGTLSVGGDGTHSFYFHGNSCSCKSKADTGSATIGAGAVVAAVAVPQGGTSTVITASISSASIGLSPSGRVYNVLSLEASLVNGVSKGKISPTGTAMTAV